MDNNSANSLLFSTLQPWYSLTQWENGGVLKMIGSNNQSEFTGVFLYFQALSLSLFPFMERLCWHKRLFFFFLTWCHASLELIKSFWMEETLQLSPYFVLLDDMRCGKRSLWIFRGVPGIIQLVYTKVYYSTKPTGSVLIASSTLHPQKNIETVIESAPLLTYEYKWRLLWGII